MKLKVCGMRDAQNLKELLILQPDYVGFIFYEKSKRNVQDPIPAKFPDKTKKVGVFVNEEQAVISKKIDLYELDYLQLHGDESPEYCMNLKRDKKVENNGLKLIKAFAVHRDFDFNKVEAYAPYCDLFLFDTKGDDYGGTGKKFDWAILNAYRGRTPFLLSGGITERDVDAIKALKHQAFFGVDINSGFERKPALKNVNKIKEFKNKLG